MIKDYLAKDILLLAKEVHNNYLEFIRVRGLDWNVTAWDDLTDDLKYSNIRQIEKIEDKLVSVGCYITDDPGDLNRIEEFSSEDRELLSIKEHEEWIEEREGSGWVYGVEKDVEKKTSPYMVPWEQLDELTKDIDRNTVDGMIPILRKSSIYVCKQPEVVSGWSKPVYYKGRKIPLLISVTGHTDVDPIEIDSIHADLDELYGMIRESYPNIDIVIMSALAEGADRIVARWALGKGLPLSPVLPIPKDLYEKTFEGNGYVSIEESIRDFNRILDSDNVYTPLVLDNDRTNRVRSFRDLSAYLISNSHILISIWDGRTYHSRGGTYDTIRMAFEGVDEDLIDRMSPSSLSNCSTDGSHVQYLNAAEDTLIYWIETDRTLNEDQMKSRQCDEPIRVTGDCHGFIYNDGLQVVKEPTIKEMVIRRKIRALLSRGDDDPVDTMRDIESGPIFGGITKVHSRIPPSFDYSFSRLDEINREIDSFDKEIDHHCLFDPDYPDEHDPIYSGCMVDMRDRLCVLDSINANVKKGMNRSIYSMTFFQAITTAFFSIMILLSESPLLVALYAISYLLLTIVTWYHRGNKEHSKYIEYRSLVESLRVQYYWSILGINDSVTMNCYGYLKNGMSWMRVVMKGLCSAAANDYSIISTVPKSDRIDYCEEHWILGKVHHLKTSENRKMKLADSFSSMDKILEAVTMVLAVVLVIISALFVEESVTVLGTMDDLSYGDYQLIEEVNLTHSLNLKIIIIALTFLFSILVSLRSQIFANTPEQTKSQCLMYEMVLSKIEKVRKLKDTHTRRNNARIIDIFHEIGIQEINQNNDWVFEFIEKDLYSEGNNGGRDLTNMVK